MIVADVVEQTGITFNIAVPGSIAYPPKRLTFDDISEDADLCIVFDSGNFDTTLAILNSTILI